MITALEIGAGLIMTGALVTMLMGLAAFELGRLVTQDDQQREVETTGGDAPAFKQAA